MLRRRILRPARQIARRRRRMVAKGKKAGMVDLFSMFRRRPAKRGRPGFARQDITALGDSVGGLVPSPVRDAPPMAREQPMHAPDQFQADFQADYQAEPQRAA